MVARDVWSKLPLHGDEAVSPDAAGSLSDREIYADEVPQCISISPPTIPQVSAEPEAPRLDVTKHSVSGTNYYMKRIHLHHDLLRKLQCRMMEVSTRLDALALHTGRMESMLRIMECYLGHMERHISNMEQSITEIERQLEHFGLESEELPIQVERFRARI